MAWFKSIVLIPCLGIALSGCASMQAQETGRTERVLAAAGFQIKLADTPQKLASLQAMPQHQLIPYPRNGKVYYMYADVTTCQCLYAGMEKNYQDYQRFALQEQIAEDQRMAAEANWNASMNLDQWGLSWY
jgi:hypothetical protein